jgi:hypothetical protein
VDDGRGLGDPARVGNQGKVSRMRTTTDTYTDKPFRWNETVVIVNEERGTRIVTPSRETTRTSTWLHPTRVPFALLQELNPDLTPEEIDAGVAAS